MAQGYINVQFDHDSIGGVVSIPVDTYKQAIEYALILQSVNSDIKVTYHSEVRKGGMN